MRFTSWDWMARSLEAWTRAWWPQQRASRSRFFVFGCGWLFLLLLAFIVTFFAARVTLWLTGVLVIILIGLIGTLCEGIGYAAYKVGDKWTTTTSSG
jgi:hypothetical protein